MPKRFVDGEALWTSNKLGTVQPVSFRSEFANLIPMAMANGSFECTPQLVFRAVYAYNRPDWNVRKVEKLLDEYERVKLLFRWREVDGKVWGYFPGIEKDARIPTKGEQKAKKFKVGINPPEEMLAKFLSNERDCGSNIQSVSGVRPDDIQHGIGSALGEGEGEGEGVGEGATPPQITHTPPCSLSSETSKTRTRAQVENRLPKCYQALFDRCFKLGVRPEPPSFSEDWGAVVWLEEEGFEERAILSDFDGWAEDNATLVRELAGDKLPRPIREWTKRASGRLQGMTFDNGEIDAFALELSALAEGEVVFDDSAKRELAKAVRCFGKDAVKEKYGDIYDDISSHHDLMRFFQTMDQLLYAARRKKQEQAAIAAQVAAQEVEKRREVDAELERVRREEAEEADLMEDMLPVEVD
jgi:hypothetical protein